jgi:hypothetical protein
LCNFKKEASELLIAKNAAKYGKFTEDDIKVLVVDGVDKMEKKVRGHLRKMGFKV